jgi:prepilin signal peptidase PulO-like enzyme (type II secretory pathway)
MPSWEFYLWLLKATWLLFVLAFGACVGSLINVLVYRLPRGMSVVRPPSRCPSCGTQLTFRENIPVFGWLLLRGRCRFCASPISPEYPLVEGFTALVFGAFYVLWYMVPRGTVWLGVDWGSIKPEWAMNPVEQTWPLFVMVLILLGSLIAMTLVDAKTFTIPLVLTWVPAAVGIAVHGGLAAWVGRGAGRLIWTAPHEVWAIPTPVRAVAPGVWDGGWPWIGAALGGMVGLGLGNVLLAAGLIGRSFADYEDWEAGTRAGGRDGTPTPEAGSPEPAFALDAPSGGPPGASSPHPGLPVSARVVVETAILMVVGGLVAASMHRPGWMGVLPAMLLGPILSGLGIRLRAGRKDGTDCSDNPAATWIMYPHARREMVREMAFLAPCAVLGLLGWYLLKWYAPGSTPPLWLAALGGSLLGYLVGGGVVWGVRILGSAAFGKEAMGLGDAHLMAAVGACLGWIDATLTFFAAAFVGLYFAVLGRVFSGSMRQAMPYGPYLAGATVLVLLCKPLIEMGLTRLLGANPPINLP